MGLAAILVHANAMAADSEVCVLTKDKFEACGPGIPGFEPPIHAGGPVKGSFQKVHCMKKGFEFVRHWHAATKNLVMFKGAVLLNADGGKEQTLRNGNFVSIPARLVHWGAALRSAFST
jgi:quercetin dioxygenase-like cupin family protein